VDSVSPHPEKLKKDEDRDKWYRYRERQNWSPNRPIHIRKTMKRIFGPFQNTETALVRDSFFFPPRFR
jgi:hypothetical protein